MVVKEVTEKLSISQNNQAKKIMSTIWRNMGGMGLNYKPEDGETQRIFEGLSLNVISEFEKDGKKGTMMFVYKYEITNDNTPAFIIEPIWNSVFASILPDTYQSMSEIARSVQENWPADKVDVFSHDGGIDLDSFQLGDSQAEMDYQNCMASTGGSISVADSGLFSTFVDEITDKVEMELEIVKNLTAKLNPKTVTQSTES